MSAADFVALMAERKPKLRDSLTKIAGSRGVVNPMVGTWRPGWRLVGAQRFYARSKMEANYARYLNWLEERGIILAWFHESETYWFESIRRGVRSYLPDFEVVELSGLITLHETKGWLDPKSKTKLKRMAKYYPAIPLKMIGSREYGRLARQVSGLITGWE